MMPKPKKLQEHDRTISLVNIDTKILIKILANQIQQNINKLIMHAFRKIKHNDQFGIMPGMLVPFNIYM